MSTVQSPEADPTPIVESDGKMLRQVACFAALAYLMFLFFSHIGTELTSAIGGIACSLVAVLLIYRGWSGLGLNRMRSDIVAAGIFIFILGSLTALGRFMESPWSAFFGLVGLEIFLLAVTAGWKEVRKAPPTALFGVGIIFIYIMASCLASIIAPYGEASVVGQTYMPWGSELKDGGIALLGTDQLGRDTLSRLIYGARNTVGVALATTALTFFVGTFLGLMAASLQGIVDQGLSRVVDVLMAIPQLIFALLILTVIGDGVLNMALVIAMLESTRVFRLARAVALNIVVMDYVEAAKLRGESLLSIIWREVLPNATAPLAAEFGLRFCFVFLFIASLSFLGFGFQPPTADWGSMVRESGNLLNFFTMMPSMGITPLVPAFCIALLTVAVNFVVDWFLHKMSGLKE
ncbi:ABC transporter permease [Pacificispira spongiicola]|nr:ABC transporter permease [Pacificispira spongiicola]